MKKQLKKAISLNKLTIARIQVNKMNHIHGGDCIPTSHCHGGEDGFSDMSCGPTMDIP
ncbi:class I lanthipeptide [uncultured Dokdonia sp.]|uniref:class I lanthipeptide n=1 Tax=uncultured Dokdonia sp. TaxID=575653 RepID=UPI002605B217|nr:class I lanthipeptide [uncultured Dokdonia sp.]